MPAKGAEHRRNQEQPLHVPDASTFPREYLVASNTFQHDDPTVPGDTYHEKLIALGFTTWLWAGENLAMNNYPDPLAEALRGLMASPTHRANILARDFTHMGSWASIRPDGVFLFAFVFLGIGGRP